MPVDYHDCRQPPALSGHAGPEPSHLFRARITPKVRNWPRTERRAYPFCDADGKFVGEMFRQPSILTPGKLAFKQAHGAVAKAKTTL